MLGLLSEGRSVRLCEFFRGGNGGFFTRAAGESFRASYARYSKMHVVQKVVWLNARDSVVQQIEKAGNDKAVGFMRQREQLFEKALIFVQTIRRRIY